MTTPVHLDSELVLRLKQRAAENGQSVDQFVEAVVSRAVGPDPGQTKQSIQPPIFSGKGGVLPGVDLNNSAGLRDLMDEADGALGR